jgi:hypothetical protein
MNVRLSVVLLSLVACSGGGPGGGDDCTPGGEPSLEIGLGVAGYTSLDDGEFPLVHGPQGGFHLEIGLLAKHLDTSDLVVGHLEGVIEGERYAQSDPWLDFRCDETHGGLVSWGTLLIYDATPEFLDGKLTTVTASVTDVQGTEVSVVQSFTIRDEDP